MFTKKKIIWLTMAVIVLAILAWLAPDVIKYHQTAKASSGFPFQVGLTNTVLTKCILEPDTGTCPNHDLCLVAPGQCVLYTAVDGTPAGGMGSQVLLADTTIGQIGLVSGTSYIGGGKSPALMDVSASIGGTAHGLGRALDKIVDWFDYIIAGFK